MTSLTSLKLSYCEPQLSGAYQLANNPSTHGRRHIDAHTHSGIPSRNTGPIPSEILELRNLEALGTRQLVGLICSFNTPSDPTFFGVN